MKKLTKIDELSDKQFDDELTCLISVNHKNIVRLLGYCSETQRIPVRLSNGHHVMAEDRRRFLCFDYMPNKSLHEYLKGIKVVPLLYVPVGFSAIYTASNF